MSDMKWTRQIHLGWQQINDCPTIVDKKFLSRLIHKWQYIGMKDGKRYSIIGPSLSTFWMWEAYNGEDIQKFKTLKEAKAYCEDNNDF